MRVWQYRVGDTGLRFLAQKNQLRLACVACSVGVIGREPYPPHDQSPPHYFQCSSCWRTANISRSIEAVSCGIPIRRRTREEAYREGRAWIASLCELTFDPLRAEVETAAAWDSLKPYLDEHLVWPLTEYPEEHGVSS